MDNSYEKQDVVIVIPIFKDLLSVYEKISLNQVKSVLSKYDMVFVAPEKFKDNLPEYVSDISTYFFDDGFFSSINGYNELLVSKGFYSRFINYKYMLIYQLDAFVFKDEISKFTHKNLDYIGAPFTFDLSKFIPESYMIYIMQLNKKKNLKTLFQRNKISQPYQVGNGGFSLRKISSFLYSLDKYAAEISKFHAKNIQSLESGVFNAIHEDLFWAFFIPSINKRFKKACFEDALEFSFEVDPELCFNLNNSKLPFGCHAWDTHNLAFWKKVFLDFNVIL